MELRVATEADLGILAECHILSFPQTLSAKLGKAFVMQSLLPFVQDKNKFMLFILEDGKCAGYVNANIRDGSLGSASSMLQSAFGVGLKSVLMKPWLLFHREMLEKAGLVLRNIKFRIAGNPKKKNVYKTPEGSLVVGLPGMCVHPEFRGRGYATMLMLAAEGKVKELGYNRLRCTVSIANPAAWKGHRKIGFVIVEEVKGQYKMEKGIN
ncbi:MAG: GNAT family N-acetyltransferase [Flavobacteriaceae bacterium]|nr:GNAT family N-acetyltransferase [Flavobacteriaceae bacterium]